MLLHLNIQNFAIVRALDIDWRNGMTTITGETGAGKSIAIDALGLCLGDRAVTNVVRANSKKAELSATFDISDNKMAMQWLETNEISFEDHECILRRLISAEGRSKAFINGSQVPLAQLKEIGEFLINIHGQHEHQLIVKAAQQRQILDDYADHKNLIDTLQFYFKQWQSLNHESNKLQENQSQRNAQRQLLQYQVNELDEFALAEGEFEQLETDYKRHSNSQQLLDISLQALQNLSENEQLNITDSLRTTCEQLNTLASLDPNVSQLSEQLNESLLQLEDVNSELRHYYERLELDPQTYQIIEERFSTAVQLAKKHHVSPENLTHFHQSLKQELALISDDESRLDVIYQEIETAEANYVASAKALTKSRMSAAKVLSQKITESMRELNMEHGQFQISVSQSENEKLTSHGLDNINFLISLNPGQQLAAMNNVASGGELSRISLAMQVILADKVITPTLIFDEVDVGISGPTAAMVGAKLQQLASNTQVICVTHLPQVACKGHQQLFVTKLTDGEHTETKVTELSNDGRVQEIARLLAGDKITDNSIANAVELLAS
ncbi:DNA repair protein RecN [Colwellia sp. 1_MG-2023]|uniref:DNA repair protein RecN n=1 Tax=Colwellia sp. 1_MG-2023 TaxID=3062649 RepID=UPI0026E36B1F|nr:DNA repair protein RecN [Colwellia sp. 1_MG-2023]MDO6444226.1 DNA repair protein RecN [Colwellia sp. 1_MG-2023]